MDGTSEVDGWCKTQASGKQTASSSIKQNLSVTEEMSVNCDSAIERFYLLDY
jgi:hypothetical protein